MLIRQCGNGCFQCVFGCFCYFFLCLSQAVALRQIFLHPGVYVLHAAGVLVKILHGAGPAVLLIQSDRSCHFRAVSQQFYHQLRCTLAILIVVVIPYLLHNRIDFLRLVRVGQRCNDCCNALAFCYRISGHFIGQLVAFRNILILLCPEVLILLTVLILRKTRYRRFPAICCGQLYGRDFLCRIRVRIICRQRLCLLSDSAHQRDEQRLRTLAVLILVVIPGLLDRCIDCCRGVNVRQRCNTVHIRV